MRSDRRSLTTGQVAQAAAVATAESRRHRISSAFRHAKDEDVCGRLGKRRGIELRS